MKIVEISRSFSRKIQLNQFEPIEIFCSYKAELEGDEPPEDVKTISHELYEKAMNDVFVEIEERGWEIWTNPRKVAQQKTKENMKKYDEPFNL